jgi:nucleotide-binding universal stress UspA family protein
MSYKQILVQLDDNRQRSEKLIAAAIRLARDFAAQLVGVYVVPGLDMTPSLAAMLPDGIVAARLKQSGDAQHDAERTFREAAARDGLAAIEWRAPAGPAIETAIAHGRTTDLIVVGQAEPDAEGAAFTADLINADVLSTGRPVLVVPYTGADPTWGEHVLVAWDGGHEASRAIADALPLLRRARKVSVMVVNADEASVAGSAPAATRLAAWLTQHGVDIGIVHQESTDVRVGEWLLSRVADSGCDLVVMGGYAHARVREMVLGGVTRSMLAAMTVPVLMSH